MITSHSWSHLLAPNSTVYKCSVYSVCSVKATEEKTQLIWAVWTRSRNVFHEVLFKKTLHRHQVKKRYTTPQIQKMTVCIHIWFVCFYHLNTYVHITGNTHTHTKKWSQYLIVLESFLGDLWSASQGYRKVSSVSIVCTHYYCVTINQGNRPSQGRHIWLLVTCIILQVSDKKTKIIFNHFKQLYILLNIYFHFLICNVT